MNNQDDNQAWAVVVDTEIRGSNPAIGNTIYYLMVLDSLIEKTKKENRYFKKRMLITRNRESRAALKWTFTLVSFLYTHTRQRRNKTNGNSFNETIFFKIFSLIPYVGRST